MLPLRLRRASDVAAGSSQQGHKACSAGVLV